MSAPKTTQAVILAGGRGTRLGPLTQCVPKPMLAVAGKPFVEHLIIRLRAFGIKRILFFLGFRAEKFMSYFGTGANWGVELHYIVEERLMGTGGGLTTHHALLDPSFFVLNGDTFCQVDYLKMSEAGAISGCDAYMASAHVPDIRRYGSLQVEGNFVVAFEEKAATAAPGHINAGVLWMRRRAILGYPSKPCSLERDILPDLARNRTLGLWKTPGLFIDIGIPEDLRIADDVLSVTAADAIA